MEVSQLAVFPFLEFDDSSCEVMGKSSSIDMSPCASIDECHLFGGGDHSGFWFERNSGEWLPFCLRCWGEHNGSMG